MTLLKAFNSTVGMHIRYLDCRQITYIKRLKSNEQSCFVIFVWFLLENNEHTQATEHYSHVHCECRVKIEITNNTFNNPLRILIISNNDFSGN